ncbi:RbtT/DalT/CsbX family MFS transporter [Curtobacterium sp. MCBA15_004]|uniref:RbtT/DalT/CsbX family MFS transporter n=1 Tax=unclassified Curtobacterium TaxID=257496 RepID=UPI000A8DF02F|nr:RbtT/DalT/CsbX family MFS transporter [Curtobacterium sp. MCBA15_004]WIA95976.1 RbtT/DalT/CsbX family MFS transporter [Curtobacterium sp. MCBA15_004]
MSTTTARPTTAPTAAPARTEGRLDRMGIPRPLALGFVAVLVFMTGNGVESNFITPHMVAVLGSPEATVATIVTFYSLAALIGSYVSGALSDLVGPRRVMILGFAVWVVFEVLFLVALGLGSVPFAAVAYAIRGFGYPLFAFAFLVWVNITTPVERNGSAVGWFYVAFTGGLPTLGSLFAIGAIPVFGGGTTGETGAMVASIALVVAGFLIMLFGVRLPNGFSRIAPAGESAWRVLTSGIRLTATRPKVLMGFLVRLINTAPEFGMFVVLPAVIADQRGWGQGRWLLMTVCVYATNILVNALFGWVGDRIGWQRTVKWFGIVGSATGLVAWWYVPQLVPAGSDWGYVLSVVAGCVFGCLLAGFVPMGAIMPALAPEHKGAAMAMYTTAAGGAAFLGTGVVAAVFALGGSGEAVTWTFVGLYACAFVMIHFLDVPQRRATPHRQH